MLSKWIGAVITGGRQPEQHSVGNGRQSAPPTFVQDYGGKKYVDINDAFSLNF